MKEETQGVTQGTTETLVLSPLSKPPNSLKGLPDYLKDPKNYKKIQKTIIEAGSTPHSHGEIGEWAKCVKCSRALWRRKETMKKLGFKNAVQYFLWKKTMDKLVEYLLWKKTNLKK